MDKKMKKLLVNIIIGAIISIIAVCIYGVNHFDCKYDGHFTIEICETTLIRQIEATRQK